MELEAFPEIQANDIYLECELMHSPLISNPIPPQEEEVYEMVYIIAIKIRKIIFDRLEIINIELSRLILQR